MGVETNFKFPIKQLYLSLVLLWTAVCTRNLPNCAFRICVNKFKFAICLGPLISPIHPQPEIIIILFEELSLKSNLILGKLRFFWDASQKFKYVTMMSTVIPLCFIHSSFNIWFIPARPISNWVSSTDLKRS
jgi:hypothetical protein